MKSYKGTPLPSIKEASLPKGFKIITTQNGEVLRREMQFGDFKEAFSYFNLLASTFSRVGYYPSIFNVYNRLVFDLGSQDSNQAKQTITTKDLWAAHLISETL
jgi:pterin-4a-carbinolamine dehydratase